MERDLGEVDVVEADKETLVFKLLNNGRVVKHDFCNRALADPAWPKERDVTIVTQVFYYIMKQFISSEEQAWL